MFPLLLLLVLFVVSIDAQQTPPTIPKRYTAEVYLNWPTNPLFTIHVDNQLDRRVLVYNAQIQKGDLIINAGSSNTTSAEYTPQFCRIICWKGTVCPVIPPPPPTPPPSPCQSDSLVFFWFEPLPQASTTGSSCGQGSQGILWTVIYDGTLFRYCIRPDGVPLYLEWLEDTFVTWFFNHFVPEVDDNMFQLPPACSCVTSMPDVSHFGESGLTFHKQ